MNFNDMSFLLKLSNIIQVLVLVFATLAVMLQISKFYVDKKIDDLKNKKEIIIDSQIGKLDSSITEQLKIIDEQNEKLENIKSKSSGSILTTTVFKNISNELKNFPKHTISILSTLGCPQCNTLAIELEELFKDAGWEVHGDAQVMYEKNNFGIVVLVQNQEMFNTGPNLLMTFVENGFAAQLSVEPKLKYDYQIIVTKSFSKTIINDSYLRNVKRLYESMNFESVADSHIETSKSYLFKSNEIESIFSDQKQLWDFYKNSFSKREVLNIQLYRYSDLRIIIFPIEGRDDEWILNITKSKKDKLLIPEKLVNLLSNKTPIAERKN